MAFSAACILFAGQAPPAQGNQAPDASPTHTQDAAPQLPAFDVVSIKPHKDEGMMGRFGIGFTPDGVSITGVPLSFLLHDAFRLPDDCILNDPEWAKSARYDIQAKVDPADAPKLEKLTADERRKMLLPLFEERFGLKYHHETRILEVYALVVAKGGPKLEPAKLDEAGAGSKAGMGRVWMASSAKGEKIGARGSNSAAIANMISTELGSTVVDRTGLTGTYDFTLEFAPEMGSGLTALPPAAPTPGASAAQPPEALGPSLFTALQEQLGLKLGTQKQPVDVIVIDRIEQPSPN
ncbi:MAG TPA: TIGR03435 family protein [Terracidiphilus sp.]